MHSVPRTIVIVLLLAFCSHSAFSKPDDAQPVTENSVEGQNVLAVVNFLRYVGFDDKADNILKWLKDGMIYWSPAQAENGDTDYKSRITIAAAIMRGKTNKESKPELFDPNTDLGIRAIVNLARTLFHEKIHAHQSNLFIMGSNVKGNTVGGKIHEFEAWTETIDAMDKWISALHEKYRAATTKAERIAILDKMDRVIEAKELYLGSFINTHCEGYKEYEEDYEKLRGWLIDEWKKWVNRKKEEEKSLNQGTAGQPPQPPKVSKNALPNPEKFIKEGAKIEKTIHDKAPARIPRDDEVEFRITPRAGSGGGSLDLNFLNKTNRSLSTEIPSGTTIGQPGSNQAMIMTESAAVNAAPHSSVLVVLHVRGLDQVQTSSLKSGPDLDLTAPNAPAASPAMTVTLVGVVLPSDIHAGDRISGTIVADPKIYAGVSALQVIQAQIPLSRNADGTLSLEKVQSKFGEGPEQSGANFTFTVPADARQIPFTIGREDNPAALSAHQVKTEMAPAATPQVFSTPPVYAGGLQVISGPLSGTSETTKIEASGRPAAIIAETPRAVYWKLPEETPPGTCSVTLRDGANNLSFGVSVIDLKMSADRTALIRGESTKFHAVISGLGELPGSAWQAGPPSEIADISSVRRLIANFQTPAAGSEGEILFTIEDASPANISIEGAPNGALVLRLHRNDFAGGSYEYTGVIHSNLSGGFAVNGIVTPLLKSLSVQPQK